MASAAALTVASPHTTRKRIAVHGDLLTPSLRVGIVRAVRPEHAKARHRGGAGAARVYLKNAMPSSGMSPRLFAIAATSSGVTTFLRCADMYGRSSTSGVAFSPTHIRSLFT